MDITAGVISDFRDYYPEFTDASVWPDAALTRHLKDADSETGKRWGGYGDQTLKARGMFAYAAHRAVLAKAAAKATEAGQIPSAPSKATSKSVGDESVSFAVMTPSNASQQNRTGDLDTTMYGQEFLRLRQRAGMGAVTTGQAYL